MATGSGPTATSIWRHLPLPTAAVLSRPAPLATDDSRVNGIRTHMTTLNASVEALSCTLTATTAELGEAKREVRALADLQTEAIQNVVGEVTRLVNRSQTAILDSLGTPAQSNDIHELTSLVRINTAKLDAIDARVATVDNTVRALQSRVDTFERQLADIGTTFRTVTDQQSSSITQLTLLLQSVITHIPSLTQPSPLLPATRKRARSVTDIESSSSPLARCQTRLSRTAPTTRPSSGGQDDLRRSTDTHATPSSFVPRQVMPGTFVKPSRPMPHSPHHPSFEVEDLAMATPNTLNLYSSTESHQRIQSDSSYLSSVSKLAPLASHSDPSNARSSTRPAQQPSTSPRTPTTMTTGSAIRTSPGSLHSYLNNDAREVNSEPVAPSDWLDFDDLDSDDTEQ